MTLSAPNHAPSSPGEKYFVLTKATTHALLPYIKAERGKAKSRGVKACSLPGRQPRPEMVRSATHGNRKGGNPAEGTAAEGGTQRTRIKGPEAAGA